MTAWRDEAFQDYMDGMKYPEIAEKHKVGLSAVKKCAATYWKKKKAAEKVTDGETVTCEKVTAGMPPRERGGANNVKHGAYRKVSWDVLEDDEERELVENIDYAPEEIAKSTLKNLMLRERRLSKELLRRKKESEGSKNLLLARVRKTKGGDSGETTEIVTESDINTIKIYEELLTRIQAQKLKAAAELLEIRERGGSSGNEAVDEWITAVMEDD